MFPVAWLAPLAAAGLDLPFFDMETIGIISGILKLVETDVFLAGFVMLFAVIIPYVKSLVLVFAQFGLLEKESRMKMLNIVGIVGKWSCADVFLICLYVMFAKGIGFVGIDIAWGMYLFTGLVVTSMLCSTWTSFYLKREGVDDV